MTVYFEDFKEIIERFEKDNNEQETYLDTLRDVDWALTDFICENKYTNLYYQQNKFLLDKFLGKELVDWLEWYLYEMPAVDDRESNCSVNGVGYLVNDFDSFMHFAQHGLCLPRKPGTLPEEE